MSRKRKIEEVKSPNDDEYKNELEDLESRFKMTKKTPQVGRNGISRQTERSRKVRVEINNAIEQSKQDDSSRTDLEVSVKPHLDRDPPINNSNQSKTEVIQDEKVNKNENEDPQKERIVNEGFTVKTASEWLQQKAKESDGESENQLDTQTSKPKLNKGIGNKFNRNRCEIQDILDDYEHIDRKIELGDGKILEDDIIISSWNVNGLKRLLKTENLQKYIKERGLDMICLNETKLADVEFDEDITGWIPEGYTGIFNCCKIRNGYSGTAIITKHKPISVKFDIGVKKHALEGRTITAEFEKFYLVSSYFPNSGEGLVGLRYRHEEWDPDFRKYVNELRKEKHVIICGDLNCCHQQNDLHAPTKSHEKTAGYTVEERRNFSELLDSGFVDTFRSLHPDSKEYSYYSISMAGVRSKTKGWRLDYFLIDKDGMQGVRNSLINHDVYGSNHLPVELIIDPQFKTRS